MKADLQLQGIRQLYCEALENNNTTMAKLYKEKLDRIKEEETKELRNKTIVENFENKKVSSVAIGGARFTSLNEYKNFYKKQ